MLGKFVAVDSASLPMGPAVRMQIKSPAPAKLKTTIMMFFNDVGYDLRTSVESGTPADPLSPADGGGADPVVGSGGGAGPHGSHPCSRSRSPRSEASDDDSTSLEDDPLAGSSLPPSDNFSGIVDLDA